MSRRSDQLRAIAQELCRVHNEWVADANRPTPDEVYWDAVDALVESFETGDIPGDCRKLAEAVERLATERVAYDERDNPLERYPHDAFFAAREDVEAGLQESIIVSRTPPPLESIARLKLLPNITDLQIAKMYGFKDASGKWAPHFVQRELDKPGSVISTPGGMDGQDWVDPRILSQREAQQDKVERHAIALETKKRKAAKKEQKPCPESPRELWEQKVSPQQSAKMLGMELEEVSAMFAQFDKDREADMLAVGSATPVQAQVIREMSESGKTAKAIASELKIELKAVIEALKPLPV